MKRVLITGATSGIGRELAVLLAPEAILQLTGRNPERLEATQQAVAGAGGQARGLAIDLMQPNAVETLAAWVDGPLDVLINNAGDAVFGDFGSASWEASERQLRLNLGVPMELVHAVLPGMLERGRGRIVNVLTIAARETFAGAAAYSAAKSGLLAFGRCLNAETRRRGVRTISILPGATSTSLWERQSGHPPLDQMLPALAVAETIRHLLAQPDDRAIDEIVLMPPNGVL